MSFSRKMMSLLGKLVTVKNKDETRKILVEFDDFKEHDLEEIDHLRTQNNILH